MKTKFSTKYVTCTAMFVVIAYLAVIVARPIPNVSGFLSYEPKDAVIVIAGFIFGPLTSAIVSLLTSLIEMLTVSGTGVYGLLMNVVSTCAFAVPAAWLYQKKRTQKGALLGLGLGVLTMAACMVLWNYIITPFYMGVPREQVAGMLATGLPALQSGKGRHQRGAGDAAVQAGGQRPAQKRPRGSFFRRQKRPFQPGLHAVRAGGVSDLRAVVPGSDRGAVR